MSSEEPMRLTAAIDHIAEYFGVRSFYAMAKALSDETMTVQPTQISKFHKGQTKVSKKVAQRFHDTYGVRIDECDIYAPGGLE